jgi:hypothetical protein
MSICQRRADHPVPPMILSFHDSVRVLSGLRRQNHEGQNHGASEGDVSRRPLREPRRPLRLRNWMQRPLRLSRAKSFASRRFFGIIFRLRLGGVALYRRLVIGTPSELPRHLASAAVRRLQLCATNQISAPRTHHPPPPSPPPPSLTARCGPGSSRPASTAWN